MRIQLDTIPVWDAVREGGECFLCDLRRKAEEASVKFYLGPSVMNPETRVKVNRSWFCDDHVAKLLAAGKPQGMALMSDTYLAGVRTALDPAFAALLGAKAGRKLDKAVAKFHAARQEGAPHCLICASVDEHDVRYAYTVAYLYGHDPDFRKALLAGKGFCLDHFERLLDLSKEALDARTREAFVKDLARLEQDNLKRLQDEVLWQTQKYKAENFAKPWNGCEDAQKRVCGKLSGGERTGS